MPIPTSTYRLQMHAGFTFAQAAGIVRYLADLGVSHAYLSPYLQAASGSTHGYDVIDHSRVNAEVGGLEGHAFFCSALGATDMGQVIDIVPNHMAITQENRWWRDVLTHGPASRFAGHFDVDWDPPQATLQNTVLLPILGDHFGVELEAGHIKLVFEDAWFHLEYYEHRLPVSPATLDGLLRQAGAHLRSDDLAFVGAALGRLPGSDETDRGSVRQRWRDTEVLKRQLARLSEENPGFAPTIQRVVGELNADPDALEAFLDRQNYRLAHWRTAGQELDYRRFFDIATLAGLRVEDPEVFTDTHELVLGWLADGVIDGVRVDHPDGLSDPEGYLLRLRAAVGKGWIVGEKILDGSETLRDTWPVDGTTGYDALNMVNGLFVSAESKVPMTELWKEVAGDELSNVDQLIHDAKELVMHHALAADINRLTSLLVEVSDRHRRWRDYTRRELHSTLSALLADFGRYRTYVPPRGVAIDEDREVLNEAAAKALARDPELDKALMGFLVDVLAGEHSADPVSGAAAELARRFQQTSAPVMAKGVEDTAFYRYHRLISLCEVGGDLHRWSVEPEAFHRYCERIQAEWPATMTSLSTHDTKRSEDVRARLSVLTRQTKEWTEFARAELTASESSGVDAPTRYLLLQSMVGAWPLSAERLEQYATKATREAKVYTTWVDVDETYESRVTALIDGWYGDAAFMDRVGAFAQSLAEHGRVVSLAQKLVQLTMPGIPDVYQGCELWDYSLVDPDNRRPIDYDRRRKLLDQLEGADPATISAGSSAGLPKLWVVRQALHARRRLGELGDYRPVPCGEGHLAFCRGGRLVTLVPLCGAAADADVELPDGRWTNLMTGEVVEGGICSSVDLLTRFPVALLERFT